MEREKLNALIALLDDSDKEVLDTVTDNLLKQGISIVPQLERAWEQTPDGKTQERLEQLIHDIQFETTRNNLREWSMNGAANVLEGACYLAQFQFPEIGFSALDAKIEQIKEDIWLEIDTRLSAVEKVKMLNYVIFDLHKYTRNTHNFYSPQNSFINQVIETRKGNPISLAIIYMAVAQKLKLPIHGVNLPKNFILAYKDELRHYDAADETEDILFYINPYNKGAILGRKEIDYFIDQQKLKPDPSFYRSCDNRAVIIRLINNLTLAYEKLGFNDKIERLQEILKVFV